LEQFSGQHSSFVTFQAYFTDKEDRFSGV